MIRQWSRRVSSVVSVLVAVVMAGCSAESAEDEPTTVPESVTSVDVNLIDEGIPVETSDVDTDVQVEAPDELGPFEVGHTSFVAVDSERGGRALPVDVWYPVDPGSGTGAANTSLVLAPGFELRSAVALEDPPVSNRRGQPLVIFSHGYEGTNKQSVELMEGLASHGFVVAAPDHVGNSLFEPGDDFDVAASNRVPDVSFLIDTMAIKNADESDPFGGRIDVGRVGVIGHSFGAMTALGTAAGWAGAAPDLRVAAIVAISGVIDGDLQLSEREGPNAGFSAAQLAKVTIPVMLMGGTEDVNVPIANNDIAFEQLIEAPVVNKVSIAGATHNHFAAVCAFGELLLGLGLNEDQWAGVGASELVEPYRTTCGPDAYPIESAVRLQNLYSVAFFKRHLIGDERYERFLNVEAAALEKDVEFEARSPSSGG